MPVRDLIVAFIVFVLFVAYVHRINLTAAGDEWDARDVNDDEGENH